MFETKACLLKREREAKEEGKSFDKGLEARLKMETLKVLERQEKFLNDFEAGEPVEIAPGYSLRKSR